MGKYEYAVSPDRTPLAQTESLISLETSLEALSTLLAFCLCFHGFRPIGLVK